MSKLDELIKEYCPNGVEMLELQELFTTRNGYTPSKSKKEFWENGTIPWFKMEDLRENGNILSEDMIFRCRDTLHDQENVRLYDETGHFIALYRFHEKEREYHIVKMFFNE